MLISEGRSNDSTRGVNWYGGALYIRTLVLSSLTNVCVLVRLQDPPPRFSIATPTGRWGGVSCCCQIQTQYTLHLRNMLAKQSLCSPMFEATASLLDACHRAQPDCISNAVRLTVLIAHAPGTLPWYDKMLLGGLKEFFLLQQNKKDEDQGKYVTF